MNINPRAGRPPVPAIAVGALALCAAVAGVAAANPSATTSASAKKTAQKALKKAKQAQKTADEAVTAAANAQSTADTAQGAANGAQSAANAAQSTANVANAKVAGIAGAESGSASLSSGEEQDLFTIGGVTFRAECETSSNLLTRIVAVTNASGAVLVTNALSATNAAIPLTPGVEVEVIGQGSTGELNGSAATFSVINGAQTVSGDGAVTAEQNADTCEMAANAVR